MATLTELYDLHANSVLRNRIAAAVWVKAQATLADAQAPAGRKTWAEEAFQSTDRWADLLLRYILGLYSTADSSAITGASDEDVQAAVDGAINQLYPAS